LQNGSTIIKLIPLIFFAMCGFTMGDPGATLTSTNVKTVGTVSVLAALAPIAFSFDGWIVTSAIGAEVTNSKRNLPIAFVVGPLIVLAVYIVYFVGISTLIGPQNVIALGDAHVDVAANSLMGPMGAKIVLVFVIISVIGTINGLILGGIRLPQSLAARNMFPFANKIKIISEQYGVSIRSAIVFFVVVMFWLVINFITQKFALLTSGDVSEISIALSYGLYIYLYVNVILLAKSGEIKSKIKGYVIPGLAIFGACIILSSVFSNSLFFVHFSICLTIILAAMLYYTKIAVHREGDQEKEVA